MIELEKKREVFTLWFSNGYSQREISTILKISRGTVHKIIEECQQMISKLNLSIDEDFLKYIEDIVVESPKQRNRKAYKLNAETISFIKSIVINNERLVKVGSEKAMNTKDLFEYFKRQKKEKPNLTTDFSIDNFYKRVRTIKNDIYTTQEK
ncbi:sigma factor-like helix-turn-helix DNA-binding protein [Paraliobacillus sp. X-1268]|uniref:sigma factor-like helix-turn-helix DNA-binding protein n=1 Tax=Paraliobacillus sp. X-1268 TaxID=2213193 RepID=UPI001300A560|nr:sigma factor-like helix-turn-helix DNA-binding protein [Paraliobacillus sp. X-1268]